MVIKTRAEVGQTNLHPGPRVDPNRLRHQGTAEGAEEGPRINGEIEENGDGISASSNCPFSGLAPFIRAGRNPQGLAVFATVPAIRRISFAEGATSGRRKILSPRNIHGTTYRRLDERQARIELSIRSYSCITYFDFHGGRGSPQNSPCQSVQLLRAATQARHAARSTLPRYRSLRL